MAAPPGISVRFQEQQPENVELVDVTEAGGKLPVPTLEKKFHLQSVKVDGQLLAVDRQGLSFRRFQPNTAITVTGDPAAAPGAAVIGGIGAGDLDAFAETIAEKLHKKQKLAEESVAISEMTNTKWQHIQASAQLTVAAFSSDLVPAAESHVDPYVWRDVAESRQRVQYMQYLEQVFGNAGGLGDILRWFDAAAIQKLLYVEAHAMPGLPHALSGTTDAAIITDAAARAGIQACGLRVLFELKKQVTPAHMLQALTELVAANIKSRLLKPVCMVSDLIDDWRLCWMSGKSIFIYSFKGPNARGKAIGMIKDFITNETVTGADQLVLSAAATSEIYIRQPVPTPAAAVAEGMDDDVANLGDLVDQLPEEEALEVQMLPWITKLRMVFGCS